jgi:molybdopterin-containing oxidoreductase family iron-sulfur binding subunit
MRKPMPPSTARDEARRRLNGRTGRGYWRALDALSGEPDFQAAVAEEFPAAFEGVTETGRRQVLKAMAASLGLAGLAACSDQPDEQALPYVRSPEYLIPDRPRHYATAVAGIGGYAQPVLGVTHMGRPTKLEGLPEHPASQGGADAFTQAAVLGLYDPDRSQAPLRRGQPADWSAFDAAMVANAAVLDARQGEGLRILTGQQTSPTFARQLATIMTRWPKARWHVLEPVNDDLRLAAARQIYGQPLHLLPRLDQAEVVVSLDDDLLGPGPHQTRNARQWSQRRRAFQGGQGDSRLFVAEPTPSLTGAVAQDRLVAGHGRIGAICAALGARLGLGVAPMDLTAREQAWVAAAASALDAARGRALVSVGAHQPVPVQALGLQLNASLGAVGKPQRLLEPIALEPPDGARSFAVLAADMARGAVDTLLILDANPIYSGPIDSGFDPALARVRMTIHAGLTRDETARRCQWHAPIEHDLETWSDARAVDGAVSLIQPLVRPFYAVRSRHAVLETLQGRPQASGHDLVAATWRERWGGDFDARWAQALRRGFIDGSVAAELTPRATDVGAAIAPSPADGLELIFRPDPCLWDGRFANNPWLQELPKPLNKVTWDNVLAVSPSLARELSLENGDGVRVTSGGHGVDAWVWVTPGQARRSVTAFLGYGRRLPGQVGDAHGYDAFALRNTVTPWAAGVTLAKTGARQRLATTQPHQAMDGHDLVRSVSLAEGQAPKPPPKHKAISFYPAVKADGPQWGMSIDTDVCIGCNACVTACDAENNIAMVGKDLVAEGRAMHWMRIDHYFEGDPAAPTQAFQPVPCMHCEDAPCEMGCPVHATVHSPDGLNLQVYNRCIGTRTCSSYCPYKVRRFNWFDFTKDDPPEHQAQRNPNVTVRSRGVMEKCTYCIQRISDARIQAKIENRPIAEGEVKTACQQTCPTEAIVFGDVSNPQSAVSRRKALARDYSLLEDENTRPRTTYLARIKPNGGGG